MTRQAQAPSPAASTDDTTMLDEILADVVAAGKDTTALSRDDRAALLVGLARKLGLNALSGAVMFLRTQGRETLYVTKQGTDQIAARERLKRETIRGPEVVAIEGRKVVLCQVRATHPDGRSEVSTATLALSDVVNDLMKCETKAKRRATLSVCGLGLLAEDEIETIPGAEPVVVAPPVARIDAATLSALGVEQREPSADVPAMLREFYARIDDIELPGESVAVWLKHKPEMLVVPAPDREAAWRALCKRTDQVGKMRNAGVWLKKAIADEEARRNINSQSVPDTLTLSVNEDAEPTAFELASSRLAQSRDLAELKAAWTHVRKVMWPTLGPAEQGALEHQKESLKVTLGQPTPPDGDPPKPRRTRRPTAPVDATSAPQETASTPDAGPAAWAPVTLSNGRVVRSAEDARALLRTYPEPRLHASAKAHGGKWARLCDEELIARAAMARRAA